MIPKIVKSKVKRENKSMNLAIFLISFCIGVLLLPVVLLSIISFFICGFYGSKILEDMKEDLK